MKVNTKMEKTVTIKSFLVQLDFDLKSRNLVAVNDALSKVDKKDRQRNDIKKRLAEYFVLSGETEQAIITYKELTKTDPDFVDSYLRLINLYQAGGQEKLAYKLAVRTVNKFRNNKKVIINVAKLLVKQKSYTRLSRLLDYHLSVYIDDIDLLLLKGDLLFNQGIGDHGKSNYENGLSLARKTRSEAVTSILTSLAQAYFQNGQSDKLVTVLNEAFGREDRVLKESIVLIALYEQIGHLDKVNLLISQTEKLFPNNNDIKIHKVNYLGRVKDYDQQKVLLDSIKDTDDLSSQLRSKLCQEKAKMYEREKNYPLAFEFFNRMNNLSIGQHGGYNKIRKDAISKHKEINLWDDHVDSLSRKYNAGNPYCDKKSPVFFVGFPRSGTTLIDQILSTHSDISVIEEKPVLRSIIDSLTKKYKSHPSKKLSSMTKDDKEIYRSKYYELLHLYAKGKNTNTIVDKLPLNIVHISLILELFPNAKIIVALRHPIDCSLSCFFQRFRYNESMANFLTMEDATNFYSKIMGHYLKVIDSYEKKIHTVRYEDLVDNLETEARALLEYLEVDWEPSVMSYHEMASKRGIINTPSYSQVTQPIYTSSTARWKNYENEVKEYMPKLQRFIDAFGYNEK